jgi:DNA-binding PadR family transcriptional regulator
VTINFVILGFLSEASLTGYDLKKKFSESEIFHWSGNNNQIYKALVELHDQEMVTVEVQYQETKPPRKIYTITKKGLTALREWMLTQPELPQFRNPLLMQMTWADQLEPAALDQMLATYGDTLREHLKMVREQARRANVHSPKRLYGGQIAERWVGFYEEELMWVERLRREIKERKE